MPNRELVQTTAGPRPYLVPGFIGSLTATQWWVEGTAPKMTLLMAHPEDHFNSIAPIAALPNGHGLRGRNRFFFKHILLPSKKAIPVGQATKSANRLAARQQSAGAKAAARHGGAALTDFDKFGNTQAPDNTVVDFTRITPAQFLTDFRSAIEASEHANPWPMHGLRHIDVHFNGPMAPVTEDSMFGRFFRDIEVGVGKVANNMYTVFHLEG